MNLKRLYIESVAERAQEIRSEDISSVSDVELSSDKKTVTIHLLLKDQRKIGLQVGYDKFQDWFITNIREMGDAFMNFAIEFLETSEDVAQGVTGGIEEIVDEFGSLMKDGDIPTNANNTMVGADNHWDNDKIARKAMARPSRMMTGNLGIGVVIYE